VAAVEAHVPATTVQEVVATARQEGVDALVSVGGGAAVDTAKATAFFLEHEAGTPGVGFADRPALAHLTVPTTHVGAAWSRWFSLIDPHGGRSQLAEGPTTAPAAVVLDDELLATLPATAAAASGVAALAHGLEAAWAPRCSPEVRAVAVAGVRSLAGVLGRLGAGDDDAELRDALRDGAALTGRALAATTPGLQHAVAGLLAARARTPYSVAHAAVLGPVTRFTSDLLGPVGDELASALDADDPGLGVERLLAGLDVPRRLDVLGVVDDDLDAVARQTGPHPWVRAHPRPVGEADVRALLAEAA
jgi:alcohol dehydrogenase class IV